MDSAERLGSEQDRQETGATRATSGGGRATAALPGALLRPPGAEALSTQFTDPQLRVDPRTQGPPGEGEIGVPAGVWLLLGAQSFRRRRRHAGWYLAAGTVREASGSLPEGTDLDKATWVLGG